MLLKEANLGIDRANMGIDRTCEELWEISNIFIGLYCVVYCVVGKQSRGWKAQWRCVGSEVGG